MPHKHILILVKNLKYKHARSQYIAVVAVVIKSHFHACVVIYYSFYKIYISLLQWAATYVVLYSIFKHNNQPQVTQPLPVLLFYIISMRIYLYMQSLE